MGGFAWVTLATNDSYSLGALVLAHSLKQAGTKQQLAVLITPGVTNAMREKLRAVFNVVQEVNILDSKDEANLKLLKRPELGVTFTKLHCWRLTQFDKCVFLDADTLVLSNCDELFEREELSAAPDVGWPDCFNSGVFVYRPSNETYEKLVQFALDKGSFDGGDQGLLNLYFSDWAHKDISKHLPFIYNMCSTACYSYLPAFKQFGGNAKIIHFIGASKPWLQYFDSESKKVTPSGGLQHLQGYLQRWWDIFCSLIHPNLTREMASSRSVSHGSHSNPSFGNFPESSTPVQSDSFDQNNQANYLDDYKDVWDEYEKNYPVFDANKSETKSIESHNTNAPIDCAECSGNIPEVTHDSHPHIPESTNLEPEAHIQFESHPVECTVSVAKESIELEYYPSSTSVQTQDIPSIIEIPLPTPELPSDCTITSSNSTDNLQTCPIMDEVHEEAGLAGALAQLTLGAPRTAEQNALEDHLRRQGWEVGNIDYLGKDSFDNIWSKIQQTLQAEPPTPSAPTAPAAQAAPVQPVAPKPKEGDAPVTAQDLSPPPEVKKSTEAPVIQTQPPTPQTPTECPLPSKPSEEKTDTAPSCQLPVKPAESSQSCPLTPSSKTDAPVESSASQLPLQSEPTLPTKQIDSKEESQTAPACPLQVSQATLPQTSVASPQTPSETLSQVPQTQSSPAAQTQATAPPSTPSTDISETAQDKAAVAPQTPLPAPDQCPVKSEPAVTPVAAPQTPTSTSQSPPATAATPQTAPQSPQTAPQSPLITPEAPPATASSPQTAPQSPQPAPQTPPGAPQSQSPAPLQTPPTTPAPTTAQTAPQTPVTEAPQAPAAASPQSPPVVSPQESQTAPAKQTPPSTPPAAVTESKPASIPKVTPEATKPSTTETQSPASSAVESPKTPTSEQASPSLPTPPPRKGSGGAKKSAKSKK